MLTSDKLQGDSRQMFAIQMHQLFHCIIYKWKQKHLPKNASPSPPIFTSVLKAASESMETEWKVVPCQQPMVFRSGKD